jgi:hypothetical protein
VPFPALGPRLGEVEVLDGDRAAPVLAGQADQFADRGAEPAVALGGGQSRQLQRDGDRRALRVPVRRDDPRGDVAVVQVGREERRLPQVIQRRCRAGRRLPRPGQVPAAFGRIERDVVPDGTGRGAWCSGARLPGLMLWPAPRPGRGRGPARPRRALPLTRASRLPQPSSFGLSPIQRAPGGGTAPVQGATDGPANRPGRAGPDAFVPSSGSASLATRRRAGTGASPASS